jgi:Glycosyltransferase family 10 (fucosyltransferase) C-term/Fucosyltransferase, N-terminal
MPMLVLFHDTLWGAPLAYDEACDGVTFTTDRGLFDKADAVVFHIPEWPRDRIVAEHPLWWKLLPAKRPGQIWVARSMECEAHYPLLLDQRFMCHFDLTMSYRLNSDVPETYLGSANPEGDLVAALRRAPTRKQQAAPIAAFVSSGFDLSGRKAYLSELARHIPIDFYGRFMNNRRLENDRGRSSKLDAIAGYRFTIAFENARGTDYVTEKFFEPLLVGSVPIYLGASNVSAFAPATNAFIDTARFIGPAELAVHLGGFMQDETAYNSFFSWKDQPFSETFLRLLSLEEAPPLRRLCHALLSREQAGLAKVRP